MQFTLMLSMGEHADYHAIARTAEEAGWGAIAMPDSLFATQVSQSDYPYADTEAIRQYIASVPFIEPVVAMTWMAAATTRLRFYPAVMKVPVRKPLVLAKALGSLAVLSNNRIAVGAGLSPWREDFVYNNVDFAKRGKLMDECIAIIRGALTGEWFEYHSENFDFGPIKMSPAPNRPVPFLIGGHSKPALARAAKIGDGWISANSDYETLRGLIAQLQQLRRDHGTADRPDFEVHVMDRTARRPDDFKRLAEAGATHAYLNAPVDPAAPLETRLAAIRRFGDEVIARVAEPSGLARGDSACVG